MNQLKNEKIKQMYQKSFSQITSSEQFREKIYEGIREEEVRKTSGRILAMKRVAFVATILLLITVMNFGTIRAGIQKFYENFIHRSEIKYSKVTKNVAVDINRDIILDDGTKVSIEQCILTNQGLDIKINQMSGEKYEVMGCEVGFQVDQTRYQMSQEMFVRFEKSYISSNVCNKYELKKMLNRKIDFYLRILYTDKNDELYEKEITIPITFTQMYQTKNVNLKQMNHHYSDYIQLKQIHIHTWYMKVEYECSKKESPDWIVLNISQEGKDLICLGGAEKGENQEVFYYECPNEDQTIKLVPVLMKENQEQQKALEPGFEIELK